MGALIYLTLCSMRNRFRVRFKRLREPRYLIGLIAGLSYFYFLFWRPRGGQTGRAGRVGGMLAAMSVTLIGVDVTRAMYCSAL